jgi:hypothetical protein
MFLILQIAVDVVFALALGVLIAAHVSGRSFSAEWKVFRDTTLGRLRALEGKIDGGTVPK